MHLAQTWNKIRPLSSNYMEEFEELVKQHASRVSNIIYQMLCSPNEVDDLTQEVFIKVFRHIKYFRKEAKFSTWLYRITVNTVWDYLRKQRHRKTIPLEEVGLIPAGNKKEDSELKQLLNTEIQKLPLKYRTVLILKDIEGLSYKEIAKIMRCRLGTVESRLFRARQALREKLEKTDWWKDFL